MKPDELMEIAKQQGFAPRKQGSTSHVIFVRKGSRSVPVPQGRDIPNRLADRIKKQLGVFGA